MKLPSKTIPYNQSIIAQFPKVLSILKDKDMPVLELMQIITNDEITISDFMSILDCLYALRKIELLEGSLHYVA